ncbi:hypothetical protein MTP99_006750 [Tenebrio molitor]|nr:hypothetical protein MTP99_006750 [Tenebrio molitor]
MTTSIKLKLNNVIHRYELCEELAEQLAASDQQMLWDFVCEKIVAGEVENIASSADIASIEVVADENKEVVSEESESEEASEDIGQSKSKETKLWNNDRTLALIHLYKKKEKAFDTGMKKVVWGKIATQLNQDFAEMKFDFKNVESKWKTMKRTYKSIKLKNSKTGNATHRWEYFSVMEELFHNRPEITPPATCTSTLLKMSKKGVSEESEQSEEVMVAANSSTTASCPTDAKPRKKRNVTINVNDRHREKMARTDRFLDSFDRLIEKL